MHHSEWWPLSAVLLLPMPADSDRPDTIKLGLVLACSHGPRSFLPDYLVKYQVCRSCVDLSLLGWVPQSGLSD
jgi:hypothetical protein